MRVATLVTNYGVSSKLMKPENEQDVRKLESMHRKIYGLEVNLSVARWGVDHAVGTDLRIHNLQVIASIPSYAYMIREEPKHAAS